MDRIILAIITPNGSMEPIECDSVHITVSDDVNGRAGGSYGIRPHGARAIYSLDEGEIKAYIEGKEVLCGKSGAGFATYENNTLTAVIENFEKK